METATPAARAAARPAAPASGPRPALTHRRMGPVRPTRDALAAHGAVRAATAFHAALGDLPARLRRTLRLLPVAVERRGAAPGRFAAAVAEVLRRMPEPDAPERGDEDLPREAPLPQFARALGADGADAETRTA